MILTLVCIALVAWIFWMAFKFYRRADWDEPAEASPDLQALHKRQAELLHVQEVLEAAAGEGKLSQGLVQEYNRFCEREIAGMEAVERAWKDRRKK